MCNALGNQTQSRIIAIIFLTKGAFLSAGNLISQILYYAE